MMVYKPEVFKFLITEIEEKIQKVNVTLAHLSIGDDSAEVINERLYQLYPNAGYMKEMTKEHNIRILQDYVLNLERQIEWLSTINYTIPTHEDSNSTLSFDDLSDVSDYFKNKDADIDEIIGTQVYATLPMVSIDFEAEVILEKVNVTVDTPSYPHKSYLLKCNGDEEHIEVDELQSKLEDYAENGINLDDVEVEELTHKCGWLSFERNINVNIRVREL